MLASGFCAAFASDSLSCCANDVPATPSIQTIAIVWIAAIDLMIC